MRNWPYLLTKFICWLIFRLGFGLEVTGRAHVPRSGAFILASNHVSYLDPPLVGAACQRRLRFMARADLFGHPLLGTFLRGVRVIPIRRGEGDVMAIRHALACLRRGEAVAIFPEGVRQFSGRLGVAKRGVGLLAEAARVPIIPVLVTGTFAALPPHATGLHRAKIRVAFSPAIPYTESPLTTRGASECQSVPSEEGDVHASRRRHEQLASLVTAAWHRLEAQQHDDCRRDHHHLD